MSDKKNNKKREKAGSTADKAMLAWTIIMSLVGLAIAGILIAIGVDIVQWLRGG